YLSRYRIQIDYLPGKKMTTIADPLSRAPFITAAIRVNEATIREAQLKDQETKSIIEFLENKKKSPNDHMKELEERAKGLTLKEGVLIKIERRTPEEPKSGWLERIVIPKALREKILRSEHEGKGHFGVEKMMLTMRE